MPQNLEVTQSGSNLWKIRYSDDDGRIIENYVAAKEKPEVRYEISQVAQRYGAVVLYDQNDREVGRYDVIWVGKEPPCEHIGDEHDG